MGFGLKLHASGTIRRTDRSAVWKYNALDRVLGSKRSHRYRRNDSSVLSRREARAEREPQLPVPQNTFTRVAGSVHTLARPPSAVSSAHWSLTELTYVAHSPPAAWTVLTHCWVLAEVSPGSVAKQSSHAASTHSVAGAHAPPHAGPKKGSVSAMHPPMLKRMPATSVSVAPLLRG